jgi:hypothetical protein
LAAQVVVLQFMVASVVATQMAASQPGDPAIACYGGTQLPAGSEEFPSPVAAKHATCVVCAFAAFAPPIPICGSIVDVSDGAVSAISPMASSVATGKNHHDPRSSQGPPLRA